MKQSKLFRHYVAHSKIDDQPLYDIYEMIFNRVIDQKNNLALPLTRNILRQQTGVEMYFRYDYISAISVSESTGNFNVTLSDYDGDTINIVIPDSLVVKAESGENITHDINLMVDKWIEAAIEETENQIKKDEEAAIKKDEDEKSERYQQYLRLKEEFGE